MTSLPYVLTRKIRWPRPSTAVTGTFLSNSFRMLNGSPNLNTSKSNDTNGTNAKYDEDGFDVTTLKEVEKEKLQVLKQRLAKNDYYEKYKTKLIQAQRNSPQVFGAKAEQVVKKNTKVTSKSSDKTRTSYSKEGLSGILNMDMMATLDKEDIVHVWKAFNEKRGKIGDSMPGSVYSRVASVASTYNMFVLPIPRNDGYEHFFCQFSNNVFHFTPLVSYQTHGENSPISLILANYTELQLSKDLILIMAEYNKKLMSPEDISILYTQILFYYAYPDDHRMSLLCKFTEAPSDFNHMDLISEYEELNKTKNKTV